MRYKAASVSGGLGFACGLADPQLHIVMMRGQALLASGRYVRVYPHQASQLHAPQPMSQVDTQLRLMSAATYSNELRNSTLNVNSVNARCQ